MSNVEIVFASEWWKQAEDGGGARGEERGRGKQATLPRQQLTRFER